MAMRCVALLSGGLDSQLAIRIMQTQGIEVEAVNFKTIFTCCQDQSAQVARKLEVPLTILDQEDDYLDVIRNPQFGYGRGANPCIDCRIYLFRRAFQFMQQIGAQWVVSGEVVGQRPMSQKRRDLETISHHSNHYDLLLRPLSAKILHPTLPERQGWVDREQLYGFYGRGRRKMIELARRLGIDEIPSPSTGCALTERNFSRKVFDLLGKQPSSGIWDFAMLKYGRHFRWDARTKVIVGRREQENGHLEYFHSLPDARSTALLAPDDFRGPMALIVGPATDDALEFACGLLLRYSKRLPSDAQHVRVIARDGEQILEAQPHVQAHRADTLAVRRLGASAEDA